MSEIEELTNRINELESKIVELELKKSKNKLTTVLEPATCSICGKTLRNKYILKTHMETVHNGNRTKVECPHCHKQLSSKYYLEKHILKHSE